MLVPDSVLSMAALRVIEWYNKAALGPEARVDMVEGSRVYILLEGGCDECGPEDVLGGLLGAFRVSGLEARVEMMEEGLEGFIVVVRVSPRRPLSAS